MLDKVKEMIKISVSIICGDLLNLARDIEILENGGADSLHLDMMDGHFVRNFGLSYDLVRGIRRITNIPMNVHLAMNEPETHLELCKSSGANVVTFHPESTKDPCGLIESIHSKGMRACVAVSPVIPLSAIENLIDHADMISVMTVNPGFAGQKLIPLT